MKRDALLLAATSFLVLFLELAFIRYLSAQVKYFSYYTNFVLLAAFLGTGIGLLAARRARVLLAVWPLAALALVGLVLVLRNVVVGEPRGEFLWGIYGEPSAGAVRLGVVPTALILFGALTATFVPLGARLGELFGRFPALDAYTYDIAGALAGIGVFAALSRAGAPPLLWFAVAFAVAVAITPGGRGRAVCAVAGVVALAGLALTREPSERWSPYYRVTVYPDRTGTITSLHVNGSLHQYIVNLDATEPSVVARIRHDYLLPYRLVEALDTVLVVGAGTGNDLALLLGLGARYIDAVEIDPVIARLGRELHPLAPYADSRVHLVVDDARAFLRRTPRRYSLIIFGTLDSQTLLSGMSSLRLDNYVYTLEAFRDARKVLRPDGRLITYHMSARPYIAARIYQQLRLAFGTPPVALFFPQHVLFNHAFVAGAAADLPHDLRALPWLAMSTRLPSDDWPYLYLDRPSLPAHYALALAGVLALAALGVGLAAGRDFARSFDAPMFALGAGFLLVETKSVTEMALLFGSTWTVNVLVFAAILAVVLVANRLVARGAARQLDPIFALLFVALGVGAFVPVRSLAGLPSALEWGLGGLVTAAPIALAALIFPRLLATRADPARALGWNVLGAIVGGVAEYGSMLWGIKALYGLAAVAYATAFVALRNASLRPAGPTG